MQPDQQQGRFFPSNNASQVRSIRRWRVCGCLASSTPANELVAPQWRQALPEREDFRIRYDGRLYVVTRQVNGSMGKGVFHNAIL